VLQLNREQMISVGALGMAFLVCLVTVIMALQARFGAGRELAEHRDVLAHLEARARSAAPLARAKATPTAAPAAAFLEAPTAGLAAAQLQAYLSQVAAAQQASVISYGAEPVRREDSPDSIRVAATLDVSQSSLQGLLYQLESRTPYVFVDSMTAQPVASGQRAAENPTLRLTLGLRALWRKV
jgi:general secretion pathway protein M